MTTASRRLHMWSGPLALALLLAGVGAFAQTPGPIGSTAVVAQAPVAADTSKLTGVEVCAHCHQTAVGEIDKTAHADTSQSRAAADLAGAGRATNCDTCHGSSKAHADAELAAERNDSKDPAAKKLIFGFGAKTTTPEMINKQCLTCHASGPAHLNISNSFHRQNEVSCVSCHSAHHAVVREKLLVKAQPELCYTCHAQQKSQFNMPFRHRVNEGLIQCTDCHDQHGSAGNWEAGHQVRQIRASATGDVVCFKCHADKQGPFVFEHAAVKTEGCSACHIAHGGANPHMLKYSNTALLCLSCHMAAAFGHAPVMDPQMATQQNACQLCHVQIHGSNFNNDLLR